MNNPIVTICITTFNRDFLIEKAVRNAFNQSYKNIEVIVIDDCSSDGTKDLCEQLMEEFRDRLKYIRHSENRGLATARNTAIKNATGVFLHS